MGIPKLSTQHLYIEKVPWLQPEHSHHRTKQNDQQIVPINWLISNSILAINPKQVYIKHKCNSWPHQFSFQSQERMPCLQLFHPKSFLYLQTMVWNMQHWQSSRVQWPPAWKNLTRAHAEFFCHIISHNPYQTHKVVEIHHYGRREPANLTSSIPCLLMPWRLARASAAMVLTKFAWNIIFQAQHTMG